MGRLAGYSAREVARVAEDDGWEFARQRGSHVIYEHPSFARRLVIPDKRTLGEGLVRDLIGVMGLSVDEFLRRAKK